VALYMSDRLKDVTVRRQKQLFSVKTGERIGMERRVFAEFIRGGVPQWAMPLAEKTFALHKKPEGISADRWLCYYDSGADQASRGWSDEERELIEAVLDKKPGVVRIEAPKLAAPYPKYDLHRKIQGQRTVAHAIKDILATYESAGFDVQHAIGYERQELNDPEVIAALAGLDAPAEVEEELVAG
jgi:hypothetical protein